MSENTKLNIEGATYVIPGEEPYNEAETKHPQDADWNMCPQLMLIQNR